MNLAAYLNQYKKLNPSSLSRSIKIALLTSFTTKGMKETLAVKCADLDVDAKVYEAPYNQYQQEILDEKSGLYAFEPDMIFLFIDTQTFLTTLFIDEKVEELISLLQILKERTKAKVILHNFEVPTYSPLGIQENKQPYGVIEAVEDLNSKLRTRLKEDPRAYLFDYNGFCSKIGKDHISDPKMYYLADMKLSLELLPALADHYLAYVLPALQLSRKCIVLDLDQTLWGGVIGEDGIGGIALGPTPEGRPFWEFQKQLLALFERGIILAVNSSNTFDDAIKVIREHPYMLLREEHFAAMKINWNDKAANMKTLSDELKLSLDSFVFIDNDPMQREMIKNALPDVLVVDLPEDPALYVKSLQSLNVFNTLQMTEEDRTRGKLYAARKISEGLKEYLQDLQIVVTVEAATDLTIPRIAQLTQKTNQFNMATRRYSEEDIRTMAASGRFLVAAFRVRDKFGEHGVVGVAIAEKGKEKWRLDTFLLSCRVIGRKIEEKMLAYVLEEARKEGAKSVATECIPTEKNEPAREFFKKVGSSIIV